MTILTELIGSVWLKGDRFFLKKYLVNQLELNLVVDIAFQFVPLNRLGVSITGDKKNLFSQIMWQVSSC